MPIKKVLTTAVVGGALMLASSTATIVRPASAIADSAISRAKGPTSDRNPIAAWEGYCTWGAQELIHRHAGYYVAALTGNAELWAGQAQSAGWTVVNDAQPRSVAVYGSSLVGGVGHVAWVDAVDGGTLTISEMNYGYGATAANGYRTTGFGEFDTRTAEALPGISYILIP